MQKYIVNKPDKLVIVRAFRVWMYRGWPVLPNLKIYHTNDVLAYQYIFRLEWLMYAMTLTIYLDPKDENSDD